MKKKNKSPHQTIQGTIIVHPRGFGFVNRPSPEEDIFIPRPEIHGAVDGDTVIVECRPSKNPLKENEGSVVKILKRARTQFFGTIVSCQKKEATAHVPLLKPDPLVTIHITKKNKCVPGDRVCIDIVKWGKKNQKTTGTIASIIGSCNNPLDDIPYAIFENDLHDAFPVKVLKEAELINKRVSKTDICNRIDLRELECVTIDPDTAKDFDDAISVEQVGDNYIVGVHIADVSHYVKPGSAIDMEAFHRCNSTYFPNRCIPMLPKALSENMCSLKPDVSRLTVSVFFTLHQNGDTSDWKIVRSVIKSKKRFTYKEAKLVLEGKKRSSHASLLHKMVDVCRLLKINRKQRGSVELFVPELYLHIDSEGNPTHTEYISYDVTHQMVEECMLKANEIVATELFRRGKQLSYRIHDKPSAESLREFSSLARAYNFTIPDVPTPQDLQQFFQENEYSPHLPYLAISFIKSNRLAIYSPENIGHYGLGLTYYCHFTSPIRRYIDLIVHRLLFNEDLPNDRLKEICEKASEKERISAKAEGSVLYMKKLRYVQHLIEKEPLKSFTAVITKVKPHGIFFDIEELMLEGFIHVSEMGDEYFVFSPKTATFTGEVTGVVYAIGRRCKVQAIDINLLVQQITWSII